MIDAIRPIVVPTVVHAVSAIIPVAISASGQIAQPAVAERIAGQTVGRIRSGRQVSELRLESISLTVRVGG